MPRETIETVLQSLVKILNTEKKPTAIEGTGFIIREDGYIITCHHVIMPLDKLVVEYLGETYEAEYREEYSDPNVDFAVLKIDTENAAPLTLISPKNLKSLSSDILVLGFPVATAHYKPKGTAFRPKEIERDTPTTTIATFNAKPIHKNKWNCLPDKNAEFLPLRINEEIHFGTSGGPVFIESLNGAIGMIQSKEESQKTAYAISWENIQNALQRLGVQPKNAASANTATANKAKTETKDETIKNIGLSAKKARIIVETMLSRFVSEAFELLDKEFESVVVRGYAASDETQKELSNNLEEIVDLKRLENAFKDGGIIGLHCVAIAGSILLEATSHIQNIIKKTSHQINQYFDTHLFSAFGSKYNKCTSTNDYVPPIFFKKNGPDKATSHDPLSFYDYESRGVISAIQVIVCWAGNKTEDECIKTLSSTKLSGMDISDVINDINRLRLYK